MDSNLKNIKYDDIEKEKLIEDNFSKRIKEIVLPVVLENMLNEGIITSSTQKGKIKEELLKYMDSEEFEEIGFIVSKDESTYELFEQQFFKHNEDNSIMLAAIYLEQLINKFYQAYLLYKKGFSEMECENCLKTLKIGDKFGWFYKYSFDESFDKNLYKYIKKIFKKRNENVHYIPEISYDFDDDKDDFNFLVLKEKIDEITAKLDEKEYEIYENRKIAEDIFNKYFNKD